LNDFRIGPAFRLRPTLGAGEIENLKIDFQRRLFRRSGQEIHLLNFDATAGENLRMLVSQVEEVKTGSPRRFICIFAGIAFSRFCKCSRRIPRS
jgi:hypothetical protein